MKYYDIIFNKYLWKISLNDLKIWVVLNLSKQLIAEIATWLFHSSIL